MKNQYLLAAAIATLLATGCQKDQELVTLGANINQPAKTYINNRYPCWNEGDQVYVNNAVYPVSAISGSSAQIADVVGSDSYRAIFPASLVAPGSNIATSATIPVTLPTTQKYQVVDGHQRVDAPMGAYTDGSTLLFHNLCSIVHVVVNNNTGSDMTLGSLKVEAANAMLSGTGTATVTGADDDITLSSDASHTVSLRLSGATNVTLAAGAQSAFDIYVPAFPTDNVTITLYTTNNYYFELTKNGVALAPNTYTTVTLNVDQLTQILAAELVDGPTFNAAIPNSTTAVVFEYNSSVTSGRVLSTRNSPVPIYGNLDGTTWRVSTSALTINANPNCSRMFSGSVFASQTSQLSSISFSSAFNTANVIDMSYMFSYCRNLENIDISAFITANVVNMAHMFDHCFTLTNIDVSNFNTSNVTDMSGMFIGCSNVARLDLLNFITDKVTNMSGMFNSCANLSNLNLSNFNTSMVTNMSHMFVGCSGLSNLDLSNFNTSNVTTMYCMFYGCCSLNSLNVSSFNTINVTNMASMFHLGARHIFTINSYSLTYSGCPLSNLDLSSFETSNVTDMQSMFSGCDHLININLSNFDMTNTINKSSMCLNLATNSEHCTITCPFEIETALQNGTSFPTSGVTFTWVRPTSK